MGTDIVSIYIFLQFMRVDPGVARRGGPHRRRQPRSRIYRTVILPLLKPAIATVVIIKGIAVYNDFYIPFLYMPSPDLGVISTSLFRFKGPYGAHWEIISAGAVLVIVPTLIVFLLLQRYIYNGFTSGCDEVTQETVHDGIAHSATVGRCDPYRPGRAACRRAGDGARTVSHRTCSPPA